MIAVCVHAGVTPARFWRLTPADLVAYLRAHSEREARAAEHVRAHAYMVSRMVWAKELPDFDDFVLGDRKRDVLTDMQRAERDAAAFDAWLRVVAKGN